MIRFNNVNIIYDFQSNCVQVKVRDIRHHFIITHKEKTFNICVYIFPIDNSSFIFQLRLIRVYLGPLVME